MAGRLTADSELLGQLLALRNATASITMREAEFDQQRARLDADRELVVGPLVALRDQLLGDVAAWFHARRDQMGPMRSLQTLHGRIGLRATAPKVRFSKGEKHATNVLKARGLSEAFVTREELSIDALKRLPPTELRQAGITFEAGERAYLVLPDGASFNLDRDEPEEETP
jgi:phage host-nuclease inhibitor protein Gam